MFKRKPKITKEAVKELCDNYAAVVNHYSSWSDVDRPLTEREARKEELSFEKMWEASRRIGEIK